MNQTDILLESGTNELEIIEFFLNCRPSGQEPAAPAYFGVNVAKVLEVIESPGLTAPSSAPHPGLLGAVPLREKALPVLDLGVRLGMEREKSGDEIILVTRFNKRTCGFLASGVTRIHRIGWDEVEPPHTFLAALDDNCITGIVNIKGRFVQLLDLEKILYELEPEQEETVVEGDGSRPAYKALIAEDSGLMRHLIGKSLTAANFEIETVGDGRAALDKVRAHAGEAARPGARLRDFVDIVVSDIEMPRMDGYTLTRRIKENAETAALPVILFSSLITDELRHKGESVGADAQISKPDFNHLADIASDLIEKARKKAA